MHIRPLLVPLALACALLCVARASFAEEAPPPFSAADAAGVERTSTAEAGLERLLRIALYDLDIGDDVPERTARVFAESLAIELRKLRAVDVVTMDEIRTMLDVEAQRQLVGCDEQSCLAEIADALGADVILTGSVAKVGDERLLGLARIEQRAAAVTQRFQARLEQARGEELLAAVGPAVEQLFPERALKEGAVRGVDKAVALRLNPPPLPPWAFWTTSALSATALTAGGALLVLSLPPYGEAERLLELSTQRAVEASTVRRSYESANLLFVSGQVFLGVGAAALATAGVLFFFTDFDGVGNEG